MTKKFVKCFFVVFILISFIIPNCLTAAAADTVEISLDVKYGQTEARTMLDMINSFRTGSETWYWNQSNTEKIYKNNLSKLEYDYNLEKIAMQRAAEIAVSFSHTRPDGTSCFTAFNGSGNTSYGENIAMGYNSASSAFIAWREDNENYSGQGHRRNMLSESFTQVGIGHCYVNGYHYWVQEFGNKNSGVAKTAAEDGNKTVKINALSSLAGKYNTTTKAATTTTTRPSTTKQTTTKQTTTKQATTKQTTAKQTTTKWTISTYPPTTTTKSTTTKSPTTTKPTTTTTKQTTAATTTTTRQTTSTTAATTKANSVTEKVQTSAAAPMKENTTATANSTTEVNSSTKATSTTEVNSTNNVNSAIDTQATEPTIAEPIEPLYDEQLSAEEATTEIALEQAPSGNSTAFFIGMATAAVIAAAGICTFIFIRSRKK